MKTAVSQMTIDSIINLTKIPLDVTTDYDLTEETEWISSLFNELEEETDRKDTDYSKGELTVSLSLKRRSEKPFGDHLLVRGEFETTFLSPCVRCLKLTRQHVKQEFRAAFLHKHLENDPEYEEVDDIFTENEEFDLYFHEKGKIDVAEMLHEQIYIHIDHFPLHDPNCKGLCPVCGTDLNEEDCGHKF